MIDTSTPKTDNAKNILVTYNIDEGDLIQMQGFYITFDDPYNKTDPPICQWCENDEGKLCCRIPWKLIDENVTNEKATCKILLCIRCFKVIAKLLKDLNEVK